MQIHKLPNIDTLLQDSQTLSLRKIAAKYGVSHQRVSQTLSHHPDYDPRGWIKTRNARIIQLRVKTRLTIKQIALEVGTSPGTVERVLGRAGVRVGRKLLPVGCDNCKREPYARGYCRVCYRRDKRRRKREGNDKI